MTFGEKVLSIVSKIPRGKVMTYKQLAEAAGRPKAYRAVGNILNRNPHPFRNPHPRPLSHGEREIEDREREYIEIPCHRVVKSNGEVGGYVGGDRRKRELLRKEGVTIN